MRDYLAMDGPILRLLTKLMNLLVLNACFLIGCLPILTIGVSWISLYEINLKMVKGEEGYVFRGFWKAYFKNMKTGLKLSGCLIAFTVICVLDAIGISIMPKEIALFLGIVIFVIGSFFFLTLVYLASYLAGYEDGIWNGIKISLLYIGKDKGRAAAVFVLHVICVGGSLITPQMFAALSFVWIILGFAFVNYWSARLLEAILYG